MPPSTFLKRRSHRNRLNHRENLVVAEASHSKRRAPMFTSRMNWGSCLVALGFWGFWTAITLIADFGVGIGLVWQLWSFTYTPVEAVLVENAVEEKPDSDGPSYAPKVKYTYSVDGKEYEGTRIRFSTVSTSSREPVEVALPGEKVGDKVT